MNRNIQPYIYIPQPQWINIFHRVLSDIPIQIHIPTPEPYRVFLCEPSPPSSRSSAPCSSIVQPPCPILCLCTYRRSLPCRLFLFEFSEGRICISLHRLLFRIRQRDDGTEAVRVVVNTSLPFLSMASGSSIPGSWVLRLVSVFPSSVLVRYSDDHVLVVVDIGVGLCLCLAVFDPPPPSSSMRLPNGSYLNVTVFVPLGFLF